MELTYLFLIILLLFIIPEIIFLFSSKKNRNFFLSLVNLDINKLQFSNKTNKNLNLIFIPHPFTNWSLNPTHKNAKGILQHTTEGFKRTDEHISILEKIKKEKNFKKIVCIGGSTTQCMEIEDYNDTWPAILNSKLKNKDYSVLNFGVGAWGTTQSLIRCQAWLPIIKPDIILIYQTKNDFTPFYQGIQSETFIHPDYQNIYGQFSNSINVDYKLFIKFLPIFKILYYFLIFKKNTQTNGLLKIYRPKNDPNPQGLNRVNENFIENIILRNELIFKIAEKYNSKVFYIPELIYGGVYNDIIEAKLIPKLKGVINKYNDVELCEVEKNLMPYNKDNFFDKMHFTLKGNKIFADIIYKILKI